MKASIIIPVLNEAAFIGNCISSIVNNTSCIDDIEILVIDGGSVDGTINKITEYQKNFSNIFLFHNKKKITPAALNIGIRESRGEYIIRLDAHAKYSNHYIDKCILELESADSSVVNVGGVITTLPGSDSLLAKSIAIVLSIGIGVGNSHFRINKSEINTKYVETVPFGSFRRTIFDEIGLFNENEHRNEDLEFNKRILKSGKKILCNQEITSTYFSRGTFFSFLSQAFNNGYIVTNKYRGRDSFHKIRHFVPLFFSVFFIATFVLITYSHFQNALISIWMVYFLVLLVFAVKEAINDKSFYHVIFVPPLTFFLHLTYGLGSICGVLNFFNFVKASKKYE
jgi:glycosyltransferase involved in cell wall biosynthesis